METSSPNVNKHKKSWKLFYKILHFAKDFHYKHNTRKTKKSKCACGKQLACSLTLKNLLHHHSEVTECTCESMQVTKNLKNLYAFGLKVLLIVVMYYLIPQYGKAYDIECLFTCKCGCNHKTELVSKDDHHYPAEIDLILPMIVNEIEYPDKKPYFSGFIDVQPTYYYFKIHDDRGPPTREAWQGGLTSHFAS